MAISDTDAPFDPASYCTDDIYYIINSVDTCTGFDGSTLDCRYYHLGPSTSTSDCFPTDWQPIPGSFISSSKCPSRYVNACQHAETSEMIATCCPIGYNCQSSNLKDPAYRSTEPCYQHMDTRLTYVYTTKTAGRPSETSTITGEALGGLNAYGIEIRWGMSDPTSTAATTSITTTDISLKPTVASTAQATLSSSSYPRPLSAGAGAGIGVGAAAAFALLLAGAFLLWRRRRKCPEEKVNVAQNTLPLDGNFRIADTMSGHTCSDRSASARLAQRPYQDTECSEMPGQSSPVELGPGR
ncbi:hypothetical protein F5Y00DRAFT_261091 [Daldinia vernicosa]|uniref:uncharacterized protein n=1 Tax=Daldinia vernicosa TaxID=114800 RepID=UPI002008E180|nr:uncharacterized protein F5Y00DRAFT_261091 [Daldinia vernicosa]KAI0849987.1 hypothetical protein F5Y00DRAFT_261091 [Daldinia vernicosa]